MLSYNRRIPSPSNLSSATFSWATRRSSGGSSSIAKRMASAARANRPYPIGWRILVFGAVIECDHLSDFVYKRHTVAAQGTATACLLARGACRQPRLQGQTRYSPKNTAQAARRHADAAPRLAFDSTRSPKFESELNAKSLAATRQNERVAPSRGAIGMVQHEGEWNVCFRPA